MTASLVIPHFPQIETDVIFEDDLKYPSITTIIGNIGSPDGLIWWACDKTANWAIDNLDEWINEDRDAQFGMLRKARFKKGPERTDAELGSAAHACFETYLITGRKPVVDAELQPYVDQFVEWCQAAQPEPLAIEVTCYHKEIGYAGTIDLVVRLDGVVVILDWKTTRKSKTSQGKKSGPRPEAVALQLAAGRHSQFLASHNARRATASGGARYYLLSPEEQATAIPTSSLGIEAGMVVHVAADHFDPYPIKTDLSVFEHFVEACNITRWLDVESKNVLGPCIDWKAS